MELTAFDKSLLNYLQNNFPIAKRPYALIAEKLNSDEKTVLERVKNLYSKGYIRRFGAFFNSKSLGYHSSLIALCVNSNQVASVATHINGYAGVTHNYERCGKYNLWFTLITSDIETETKILQEISSLDGVEDILKLRGKKTYKINVNLRL